MRPAVRARRRTVSIGSVIALVLAAALVLVVFNPFHFGPAEQLLPHWGAQALTGAVVTGPAEGWVVGTSGLLLKVDGNHATAVQTPVTDDLYSAASGAHDAWAVGAHGAVLHWVGGTEWIATTRPTTINLYGVAETTTGAVWAVGAAGTILHYTGKTWQQVSSPTWHALAHVMMLANGTGWAVGRSGTILHFAKGSWDQVASPTTHDLFSVSVDSSTGSGFIVGAGGTILTLKGGAWSKTTSPTTQDLYDVSSLSDGGYRAVGAHGAQVRFAGDEWIQEAPQTSQTLNASTPEGWLLGAQRTLIVDVTNIWTTVNIPSTGSLYGVVFDSSGRAWAVGASILHEAGGQWTTASSPSTSQLNGVAVGPGGQVWAVGSDSSGHIGVILHEAGGKWTTVSIPGTRLLSGVAVGPDGQAWAVGSVHLSETTGVILHEAGGQWSTVSTPPNALLSEIAVDATGQAWAVGGDLVSNRGVMLQFSPIHWLTVLS